MNLFIRKKLIEYFENNYHSRYWHSAREISNFLNFDDKQTRIAISYFSKFRANGICDGEIFPGASCLQYRSKVYKLVN